MKRYNEEKEYTYESAFNQAVRFLGPRFLSRLEMTQKLSRKGIPEHLIEEVIERLVEMDYINDDRLAEEVLRIYMDMEKYSRLYISHKMKERGLEIGPSFEDYDELQVAFRLVEMRFGLSEGVAGVSRKKVINFLKNRAFSFSTISQVCSEFEFDEF